MLQNRNKKDLAEKKDDIWEIIPAKVHQNPTNSAIFRCRYLIFIPEHISLQNGEHILNQTYFGYHTFKIDGLPRP